MQKDCEIYVDPEEDEVFFGCVSDREKSASSKLVNCTGSSPKDDRTTIEVLNASDTDEKNLENTFKNEQSIKEVITNGITYSTDSHQEVRNSFESSQDSCEILSNNTSVELDHNYSTPMKHKIDKSILTTPKSIVKADKDGGFLKVLSEIALVKAEAEGDNKSDEKREDENKENKAVPALPEIKITEATPEKGKILSPPRNINTEFRRFRIIYNSPRNENNADSKVKIDSLESEKNIKNLRLDRIVEKRKQRRKSINLIDFNELSDEQDLNECIIQENEEETQSKSNDTFELMITIEPEGDMKSSPKVDNQLQKTEPKPVRFSKDARKVVEVLKKSTADDTLNFTIPELNIEEEENSFLSPEPVSAFDETVILNKKVEIEPEEKQSSEDVIPLNVLKQPADNKITKKFNTMEKDRCKFTPISSQSKLQSMKYFSEKRIYNQSEMKNKCVKLPVEEKRPVTVEKVNAGRMVESNSTSRIPVYGAIKSKIALGERPLTAKTTPSKAPSGKIYKNPKFNYIESPINAYIHNKPTSLVVNVKPDVKKNGLTKTLKSQAASTEKKIEEKTTKMQNPKSAMRLPFVEYKSATTYKIEKRSESRLPRLASNVMKLIGTHSPKVLRHEGRYYMNSPRKHSSTENTTIVADPNEVSVVLSQPVQKSHTIK